MLNKRVYALLAFCLTGVFALSPARPNGASNHIEKGQMAGYLLVPADSRWDCLGCLGWKTQSCRAGRSRSSHPDVQLTVIGNRKPYCPAFSARRLCHLDNGSEHCIKIFLAAYELILVPQGRSARNQGVLDALDRFAFRKDQRHSAMLPGRNLTVRCRSVDVRGAEHGQALLDTPLMRFWVVGVPVCHLDAVQPLVLI